MRMPLISRIIFIFVSLWMVIGAHLADYNGTHIFNPNWPPHAKLHDGQTLSFSILLAILTIYAAHRKTSERHYAVFTAAVFAAIYFVTQAMGGLYPGTAFFDPDWPERLKHTVFGMPIQILVGIFLTSLVALASWLALRKNARWV